MKIKNENNFVEFKSEDAYELGFACSIETFCDGFGGKVSTVWFSEDEIKEFINGLEVFEKIRQGSVELLNMSIDSQSNPLKFVVFSTDSLGHLAVRVELKKDIFLSNSIEVMETSVCFEFDPTLLPTIISDFKALFTVKSF